MGKGSKKKPIKVRRIGLPRVRCENDHFTESKFKTNDPWLRRLYVLWAPVNPNGTVALPFHLAITDDDGYLTPKDAAATPVPDPSAVPVVGAGVQPLLPDVDYFFYFVRHPGDDLPTKILTDVNNNSKKWGEAKKYKLRMEETGKDENDKPITELVLRIPEDPLVFTPSGSDLYKNWVLFRGMPGTGIENLSGGVVVELNVQCPPLREQVKRLQYHLGALRYWVGSQNHPYYPQPFTSLAKQVSKTDKKNYATEGVFETITWNAVLKFQRDAKAGNAVRLDSLVKRIPFVAAGSFDPTPEASSNKTQIAEAPNYVGGAPVDPANVKGDPIEYETVVDKATGDTIKKWLENEYRKPDSVLISRGGDDSWMNSATLESFNKWSNKLKELGFPSGLHVSNVLRDPRMSIDGDSKSGQIPTSLHKSGFALDLTMKWATGHIEENDKNYYPLYYEVDPSAAHTKWIVYAKVDDSKIPSTMTVQKDAQNNVVGYTSPTDSTVEYKKTILNFIYDPLSTAGGRKEPLSIPNYSFLNVTYIAESFKFTGIPPHASGWQGAPAGALTISDAESFKAVRTRFNQHITYSDTQKPATEEMVTINGGQPIKLADWKDVDKYYQEWILQVKRFDPTPEITITPGTKESDNLIKQLKNTRTTVRSKFKFMLTPKDAAGEETTLGKNTVFPDDEFTLRPIITPFDLKPGDAITFPELVGLPGGLEWWHFQYQPGYEEKTWLEILGDIGWTPEGLGGIGFGKPIYGYLGLGYSKASLNSKAAPKQPPRKVKKAGKTP